MKKKIAIAVFLVFAGLGVFVASERTMHRGPGGLWIEALQRAGWLRPDVLVFPGFAKLERRATGNDALACPGGHCPGARADIVSAVYSMPAERLRVRINAIALAEPRVAQLKTAPNEDRWLQFQQASAALRFPDIIDVEIISLGPERSTLAIWSRSVVGRKDFGVNRARVERWLAALGPGN